MYLNQLTFSLHTSKQFYIRREFMREILYSNIAIIVIQHSKIYFVDNFVEFPYKY